MIGILEKILSLLLETIQKKRMVAGELEGLKEGLLMTTVSNNLDEPLRALHTFFTKNPTLLKQPENRLFVTRYLMDPYRQAWGSVPGMWSVERWNQLRADTASLRIV